MKKTGLLLLLFMLVFPSVMQAKAEDDLKQANESVANAIQAVERGDLNAAKTEYDQFNSAWFDLEDGVKEKSKAAYRGIEDAMGEVAFALTGQPPKPVEVSAALQKLQEADNQFIAGNYSAFGQTEEKAGKQATVSEAVALLDQALDDLQKNDVDSAKGHVSQFRESWLDIEGVVLTQSSAIYSDAERDMVTAYAELSANPADTAAAQQTIRTMRDYLAPLAGKTSYTMFDATTILLREGLEALLVIVALLGFLKKSGNSSKRHYVWYGLGAGLLVSVILGVLVQLLFSSGAFGSNNFLIAGCTGLFAAVMLLYMSYWLHSKSSLSAWHKYIGEKSSKALASGSLVSLAVLAFLAVFREGTETVLFFIGMASSISLPSLLGGILIGAAGLSVLAYLILKIGLKIPVRPFFLVSSILVFYLCFKFMGMGVHGLQLAGVIRATHASAFRAIAFLAFYPTWESIIPQLALLAFALVAVLWNRRRELKLRKQFPVSNVN